VLSTPAARAACYGRHPRQPVAGTFFAVAQPRLTSPGFKNSLQALSSRPAITLHRRAPTRRSMRIQQRATVLAAGATNAPHSSGKAILVTGGNDGIGAALCRQLAVEHGCRVLMGARNAERGEVAAAAMAKALPEGCGGSVELVLMDVADDVSVSKAAAEVAGRLGDDKLYAVVNNAGIGLSSALTSEQVLNTNLVGTKRVCDAFTPMLSPTDGRIVNVGSGGGPNYVNKCPPEAQSFLCRAPESWEEIEAWAHGEHGLGSAADINGGYGVSKALVACYTMLFAKQQPELLVSVVTPGYIATKLTAGRGATKAPEDGTVSLKHCLFAKLEGSGYYYGSDAVRSPLHFMRNPGEPAYDGVPPF